MPGRRSRLQTTFWLTRWMTSIPSHPLFPLRADRGRVDIQYRVGDARTACGALQRAKLAEWEGTDIVELTAGVFLRKEP